MVFLNFLLLDERIRIWIRTNKLRIQMLIQEQNIRILQIRIWIWNTASRIQMLIQETQNIRILQIRIWIGNTASNTDRWQYLRITLTRAIYLGGGRADDQRYSHHAPADLLLRGGRPSQGHRRARSGWELSSSISELVHSLCKVQEMLRDSSVRCFFDHSIASRIESKDLNFFIGRLHLTYSESAPRFFNNLQGLHRVNVSAMGDGIYYIRAPREQNAIKNFSLSHRKYYCAYSLNAPNEVNLA